jgi:CO/xanthine dehydrogenase FAD-binding subunit
MTLWKEYHLPQSVIEALQSLTNAPGAACIIAGGSDLLLDLQQGRHPPVHRLVDITCIPELNALEIRQDELFIGSAVPLSRIVESPLVQKHAPGQVEACGLIGGPQVRNTATLGGNVAHALPAADGTIALLAHNAQAEIVTLRDDSERRWRVPITEMFLGPGRSTLEAGRDLLVGFYLPLRKPGQASAFQRVMRPQGVAIAILNLAAWVQRNKDVIEDVRISIGPAGPKPLRLHPAEEVLRGHVPDDQILLAAQETLLEYARFRTSPHRATSDYRKVQAGYLLSETLGRAYQRAGLNF